MHKCPHCQQELSIFAFHCIRCSKKIGVVQGDGDMLALWWLDGAFDPVERICVKALVSRGSSVNVRAVEFRKEKSNAPYVLITLANEDLPRKQDLIEVFRQATSPTQEWKV